MTLWAVSGGGSDEPSEGDVMNAWDRMLLLVNERPGAAAATLELPQPGGRPDRLPADELPPPSPTPR